MNNKQIVDTQTIAAEFQSFYNSLHNIGLTSEGAVDGGLVNKIWAYLKALELPAIPSTALEDVEQPISVLITVPFTLPK